MQIHSDRHIRSIWVFWDDYWKTGNTEQEFRNRNVPDLVLLEYLELFRPGKALDLGMGEGRNAFFLANNGFQVDGYDISRIAVERCADHAKRHKLSVNAEVRDIANLRIPVDSYDLTVLSMVVYFFTAAQTEALMLNVIQGLRVGGFLYLSTMATSNPSYARCRRKYEEIEKNTFYLSDLDMVRHYSDREEIQDCLTGLERIYFAEVEKLDITHGDPHYHNLIECLAQKARVIEPPVCSKPRSDERIRKRRNP